MHRAARLLLLPLLAVACTAPVEEAHPTPPAPAPVPKEPVRVSAPPGSDIAAVIRERYTKSEHLIAMRDGVRLFTNVYVPKDHSRSYPMLFVRTPYGVYPYGSDAYPPSDDERTLQRFSPSPDLVRDGYVFVHQDVRGRAMSEGTFADVRPASDGKSKLSTDESTDAYDTIDWLVHNVPNNDGHVGLWGISYPGFYAAQGAIDAHPALKCVSPQAPVTDWFDGDDFHHNGALMLADAFEFSYWFSRPRKEPTKVAPDGFVFDTPDRYEFFRRLGPLANVDTRYFHGEASLWNDLIAHPNRDEFWKARDPRPRYKNAKPAIMVVGGLFDAEDLWGALATYHAFQDQSPGGDVSLVMGPWYHGGWNRSDGDHLGDVSFGQKTSPWYRENVEKVFFERCLGQKRRDKIAEATIFETGTDEWHRWTEWPPKQAKKTALFLRENGGLETTPPSSAGAEKDDYPSDPKHPVPYREGFGDEHAHTYMVEDQRFASRRPDVVTYETAVLTDDVALAGPMRANLWVSTTGTDSDFVVKIIDVYPDDRTDPDPNPTNVTLGGFQQLLRAEVMRGKFRNGMEHPEAFAPGTPTPVSFGLPDVSHVFRRGHRLMVQIQSSWFPLVDRNPQTFVDISQAKEADFHAVTNAIFHSAAHPSSLELPLLRGPLPE